MHRCVRRVVRDVQQERLWQRAHERKCIVRRVRRRVVLRWRHAHRNDDRRLAIRGQREAPRGSDGKRLLPVVVARAATRLVRCAQVEHRARVRAEPRADGLAERMMRMLREHACIAQVPLADGRARVVRGRGAQGLRQELAAERQADVDLAATVVVLLDHRAHAVVPAAQAREQARAARRAGRRRPRLREDQALSRELAVDHGRCRWRSRRPALRARMAFVGADQIAPDVVDHDHDDVVRPLLGHLRARATAGDQRERDESESHGASVSCSSRGCTRFSADAAAGATSCPAPACPRAPRAAAPRTHPSGRPS